MDDQHGSELKVYTFPFQGHTIKISYIQRETHKLEGVGVTLWPASMALCTFLVNRLALERFQQLRVLELGAGVGLLGIALAKIGARVTLTDADATYAPGVLKLLRENVSNNLELSPDEVRGTDQLPSLGTGIVDVDVSRRHGNSKVRASYTCAWLFGCYVSLIARVSTLQLVRSVQPLNWGEPLSADLQPPYQVCSDHRYDRIDCYGT